MAGGNTNIAAALRRAIDDILASNAPQASRNIIVFSDGKHNDPNDDPYTEAERACDNNIFVHTIGYGNADSAALDELSKCGTFWIGGTEQANDPLFGEPDPLEIKVLAGTDGTPYRRRRRGAGNAGPARALDRFGGRDPRVRRAHRDGPSGASPGWRT